ncbi:MAG: TAT-variant-translocated molybdopterin oxidoreductase, partial [Phycisphaerae bacterium]
MSSITESRETGPAWRSLNEFESDPEFLQHLASEFVSYTPEEMRKPTRRGFLAYMGASAALAGTVGCRWPREQILPYARRPDNRTPGEPVAFATAMEINGFGIPVLATSIDGRPIKIDGNDQHPLTKGKSSAAMQASVLSLYDPDRSKHPVHKDARHSDDPMDSPAAKRARANATNTWQAFLAEARKALDAAKSRDGAGIAILSETTDSVSLEFMRNKLATSHPQVRWFHWSPCTHDNVIAGTKRAFGKAMRPHLQLAKADIVVSIDDDFLHEHPAALKNAREFASRRTPDVRGGVSRVYSIDSALSLTATNADVRIRVRPEQIPATLGALISEVMQQSGSGAALSEIGRQFADMKADAANAAKLKKLAAELFGAKGRSVVSIGAQHSAEAHAAVAWLNDQLGNTGKTITYTEEPRGKQGGALESIQSLVKYINDGTVDTLIMLGGNPVYDAPADLKFADALGKTKTSIHLSDLDNETSRRCTWLANRAHYLESWDASRAYDGSICAVQPLITPLYDGKTPAELVAALFDAPETSAYEITQAALNEPLGQLRSSLSSLPNLDAAEDTLWNRFLHTGYLTTSALDAKTTAANETGWLSDFVTSAKATKADSFTIAFHPDRTIGTGDFANNGWLQELPDPLTKITWDNAAVMAPSDAKSLGVKNSSKVTIEHGGNALTLPVFILPGQVAGVISLALGYGRTAGGAVLRNAGFDVYPLRTSQTLGFATGAKVSKAGGSY